MYIYTVSIVCHTQDALQFFWGEGALSVSSLWQIAHGCSISAPLAKIAATNLPLPTQLAKKARKRF